jgi:hypothetical protein
LFYFLFSMVKAYSLVGKNISLITVIT